MHQVRPVDRRHGDLLPRLRRRCRAGRILVCRDASVVVLASDQAEEVVAEPARSRSTEASRGVHAASEHEAEARRRERTDAPRAVALYRQAIIEYLESSDHPLDSQAVRRDMQRIFDRLSLVLKRSGLIEEALEEIDSAAYLGLVDGDHAGTKARREALVKRRETLRHSLTAVAHAE